jgi:choline monooxygenase
MSGAHRTLPGTDYHSPEVYQADLERIFLKSWLYAGRVEQVDEPGKWFTVEVAGESIIVVGDKDGGINAFYNVTTATTATYDLFVDSYDARSRAN